MTDHTANYGWEKPTIGASSDDWGRILNESLDGMDASLHGVDLRVTSVTDAMRPFLVPAGFIGMWSGSAGSIPAGWALCNGANGTPNLVDRFVVGAGSAYAPGNAGGSISQTPSITVAGHQLSPSEMPTHDHGFAQTPHNHPGSGDSGHTHTLGGGAAVVAYRPGGAFNQTGASFGDALTGITDAASANISIAGDTAQITFHADGGNGSHAHGASSSAIDVRPPYYALCFIMKV